MTQISLFPTKVIREEAFGGTASLKMVGITLNGERYALKRLVDDPLLPITEWLCYHLCQAVNIPTPGWAVMELLDGSLAFGSRIDKDTELLGKLSTNPVFIFSVITSLAAPLSRFLAVDYFLPNPDRHINNILVRPLVNDQMVALAFDWSEVKSLPTFLPWPWTIMCNSNQVAQQLSRRNYLDTEAALAVNAAVCAIPSDAVRGWLEQAPAEWIPTDPGWIDTVVKSWTHACSARANQVP